MENKHKIMLPVRLFFNLKNSGPVVFVSIDLETVLDLRHLLIVTIFPKGDSLLAEINKHETSLKLFERGGGTDLYWNLDMQKKKPHRFPKIFKILIRGGWSEKRWDEGPCPPPPDAMCLTNVKSKRRNVSFSFGFLI